jgi:hypothetical protein
LIFVQHFAIVKQPTNQRALAIVDAAASDEAQELFAFMLFQVSQDVLGNKIALVRHA